MNQKTKQDSVPVGATVYSKSSLVFYDFLVHTISNRFVWGCPKRFLIQHSRRYLATDHLEIGVGSGKLLKKTLAEKKLERLVLADVNSDCLAVATRQLQAWSPTTWDLNLLEPGPDFPQHANFKSIGLNYVLHCLPCSLEAKLDICRLLHDNCLAPGGVLFGVTLMQKLNENWRSRKLMRFYNRKGIFGNENDTLEDFQQGMEARQLKAEISTKGCVCFFSITK